MLQTITPNEKDQTTCCCHVLLSSAAPRPQVRALTHSLSCKAGGGRLPNFLEVLAQRFIFSGIPSSHLSPLFKPFVPLLSVPPPPPPKLPSIPSTWPMMCPSQRGRHMLARHCKQISHWPRDVYDDIVCSALLEPNAGPWLFSYGVVALLCEPDAWPHCNGKRT